MNKAYNKQTFRNFPNTSTPLDATNLNKIDTGLSTVDDRVISLDLTKANQSDLLQSLKNVAYNTTTGVFTFTYWDGTVQTADLNIEKIPVSFTLSPQGVLTMTTADGTTYTADIGDLIKTYTFVSSTTITATTQTDSDGNKTVSMEVADGSITGTKLQPNYLSDITTQANNASASATAADGFQEDSEAWANGTRGGTPVDSTDPAYHNNAKYWSDEAQSAAGGGVTSFNTRTGSVTPASGDYSIEMITPTNGSLGQVPTVNAQGVLEMATPAAGGVSSFNSRTGAVVPAQDDYTIDQVKATGTAGQIVALGNNGKLEMINAPTTGVASFNSRTGAVVPAQDDYTIDQIKATGTAGQIVSLGSNGKLELTNAPTSGVSSFNGRTGAVTPTSGDYTGADVPLTGYTEPSSTGAVASTDTTNQAIGKIERKADNTIELNTFNIATSDWQSNSDPNTVVDYPYIATKTSSLYTNTSTPIWQMNGAGTIPTEAERESINMVLEAVFSSSGVTLYATDIPTDALVLEVKGR